MTRAKALLAGVAAVAAVTTRDYIRTLAREWLLDDAERDLDDRVDAVESTIGETRSEWAGVKNALDQADVWGEETDLESVDILVVAGRNHYIEGATFGGPVNVTGSEGIVIHDCRVVGEEVGV